MYNVKNYIAHFLSNVIGILAKITHMTMHIKITPEYEDEKGTFSQTGFFAYVAKRLKILKEKNTF